MSINNTEAAKIHKPTWFSRIGYKISTLRRSAKSWATQRALNLVVWLSRDSNYIGHTRREVPEWFKGEGPNRWIADGTVELLAVLNHQGHSGGSIGFAVKFFSDMALFKPWGPLTGDDSEWRDISGISQEPSWQNIRASHVFKDTDGLAYDIQGKMFREPSGLTWTGAGSRVYIEFPYTPKTEYVDVPARV